MKKQLLTSASLRVHRSMLFLFLAFTLLLGSGKVLSAQDNDIPSITFKTDKAIGEEIRIGISPIKISSDGEFAPVSITGVAEPAKPGRNTYTLTSQEVKITGRVWEYYLFNIELTSLDVTNNTELKSLWINYNKLEELDLTGCSKLQEISCMHNKIKELDFKDCPNLALVTCHNNELRSLKTAGATALSELMCNNNKLTSLDFSSNPNIHIINAFGNEIGSAAASKLIASLPAIPNPDWGTLQFVKLGKDLNECTRSDVEIAKQKRWRIKAWDEGNLVDYPGTDEAFYVKMSVPQDLIGQSVLIQIKANGALSAEGLEGEIKNGYHSYKITASDITIHGDIIELNCNTIGLTALDVSHLRNLKELDCSANQLTTLDVHNNLKLEGLDLMGNKVDQLILGKNNRLEWINCAFNNLKTLNLYQCNAIRSISCYLNNIDEGSFQGMIMSLPIIAGDTPGKIIAIETAHDKHPERNRCDMEHVKSANKKGWRIYDYQKGNMVELVDQTVGEGVMTLTFDAPIGSTIPLEIFADGNFSFEGLEGAVNEGYGEYTLTNPVVIIHGDIKTLRCFDEPLTAIDVSANPKLELLHVFDTKLKKLDLSHNEKLRRVIAKGCNLKELTLGNNPNIQSIAAHTNDLTAITLPTTAAPLLDYVDCFRNKIGEEAMGKLIEALPDRSTEEIKGELLVFDSKSEIPDGNRCLPTHVEKAKDKGWKPIDYIGGENGPTGQPYDGWTSIGEVTAGDLTIACIAIQGRIEVKGAQPGGSVVLYSLSGETLRVATCDTDGNLTLDVNDLPHSNYLLRVGGFTVRIAFL